MLLTSPRMYVAHPAPAPAAATACRPCRHPPCNERLLRPARHISCHISACRGDLLLVDAANVLSRAHADHRCGCRMPGEVVAGRFADWLRFLTAVAQPQLMVAVFDTPRSRRVQQPPQREQLAPEYLQRRKRRQQQAAGGRAAVAAGSSSSSRSSAAASGAGAGQPGGDPLRPFKQEVEQLGGVCLEAVGGWEADDGLAAACHAMHQCHPAASILVASGDTDMQQLLTPQVAWLQLRDQSSLTCPLGAELVTAASFQLRHGFPPEVYADWLAFTGKKEASIAGVSVGAKCAAKLLGRYGSLEGVLAAAAAGQLKGWGPAVQRLLGGGSTHDAGEREALLRRNRQLFAVNRDPAVVAPRGMWQLQAALEQLHPAAGRTADPGNSSSSSGGSTLPADLAWQHPMHVHRWRHLQQQLGAGAVFSSANQQVVTPKGLAVDELSEPTGGNAPRVATFYVCPCDVAPGGWPRAVDAVRQRTPPGGGHTAALAPLLHGAMRHHVRLVQRAGYRVELRLPPQADCV